MKPGFNLKTSVITLITFSFLNSSFGQADTLWYAHKAFGDGRYDDAINAYQAAIYEGSTWDWLPDLIETVQIRKDLGAITPADTHKIKVIIVVELNEIAGTDTTTTVDTTPAQKKTWKIYFDVFRETIESFSAGRWTIAFDSVDAISHYQAGSTLKPDNPDQLNLEDEFFDSMSDFDSYITFSNTISPALGLARRYPYVNGAVYGPHRGMDAINSGTHGYNVLLHEFFHIVEWVSNRINPAHGFQANVRSNFPDWTGITEFDYYRWHFSETLGNREWSQLNHRTRWIPFKNNVDSLNQIRTAYSSTPIADRLQADNLFDEGMALKGPDITLAVDKWEEAITLSPFHVESLNELHDYYRLVNLNPVKVDALYEKLRLTRAVNAFYTLDTINRDYGDVIGMWHREDVGTQWKFFDWNFTSQVNKSGCYDVTFYYTNGFKALDMDSVSIVEDGVKLSLDPHVGFSGGNVKTDITYQLKIPTYKSESEYVLRAKIRGNGGVDSYGQVHFLFTSDSCTVIPDNEPPDEPPVVVGIAEGDLPYINIYPNPASRQITIQGPRSSAISIYNTKGQLVLNELISNDHNIVQLNLESGYYILQLIKPDGNIENKRLIVR